MNISKRFRWYRLVLDNDLSGPKRRYFKVGQEPQYIINWKGGYEVVQLVTAKENPHSYSAPTRLMIEAMADEIVRLQNALNS